MAFFGDFLSIEDIANHVFIFVLDRNDPIFFLDQKYLDDADDDDD